MEVSAYPEHYAPVRVERATPSARARFKVPWVPYQAGTEVLKAMSDLLGRPSQGRPPGIALIAEANFGKSHLLDYFADCYPDLEEDDPRIQILHAETPPKADGAALLRELLGTMGATFNTRSPLDVLLNKFCVRAKSLRVLMIIIDEITNGAWGRREASVTLVHTIRSICNRLGRPVVIAGTSALDDLLRNDAQLSERFRRMRLPAWTDVETAADLIATFEETLEMPEPSNLATETITSLIVQHSAGGKLGRIAELLRDAARIAKRENARSITKEHIDAAALLQVGYPTE